MGRESDTVIDAFEDLLDQERQILLIGSLDGLSRIAEHKSELARRLGAVGRPEGLWRLKAKAERNARLLEAAGAGIRSVIRRLSVMRDGPEPLSTYSANGRKTKLGADGRSVERRA